MLRITVVGELHGGMAVHSHAFRMSVGRIEGHTGFQLGVWSRGTVGRLRRRGWLTTQELYSCHSSQEIECMKQQLMVAS